MTYSNINKDKAQVKRIQTVLKMVGGVILILIILSAVGNIVSQYKVIREAEIKVADLQRKSRLIEAENKQLEQRMEYATSSAFRERKAREWLGMGGNNDFWVDLPMEELKIDFDSTKEIEEPISNVKKWWQLFTK